MVSDLPFNAETEYSAHENHLTPTELFYVRNHFPVPDLDPSQWSLRIDGEVDNEVAFTLNELMQMPSSDQTVTLECAGNGRTGFQPQVPGEQWDMAAASTAVWTGVPLRDVLSKAGLRPSAVEIVCEGADAGIVADVPGEIRFERSLPIETALHPDTLIAYGMNGEPLTPDHGFPARLIVPGWYGVASVKWLVRLRAVTGPFRGFYQFDRYVMRSKDPSIPSVPLRETRVRALIVSPQPGTNFAGGPIDVRGLTWSGAAAVERVEVQVDGGPWQPAHLLDEPHRYAWRRWRWTWDTPTNGHHHLRSRATDAAGNIQPDAPEWNVHGYSNNAIQTVEVEVS